MLQEISPLNRLAQAVAAAERADKRLLEKPLNDWGLEIKVRGLIAKMVLVTARQTLRTPPMALPPPVPAQEFAVCPLTKEAKLRARQAALKLKLEEEQKQAEFQSVDPLVEPYEPEPISFAEAARRLGKGVNLVRRRFMKMPGVIKIPAPRQQGKRKYYNWAIPVALFDAVRESWKVK